MSLELAIYLLGAWVAFTSLMQDLYYKYSRTTFKPHTTKEIIIIALLSISLSWIIILLLFKVFGDKREI